MSAANRRGVSLFDTIIALTVAGLLIALVVPALVQRRSAARNEQCRANLRQYFISMVTFSEHDTLNRFASRGGFDGSRDGCLDSFGFVADAVNAGRFKPQEHLCPENPGRQSASMAAYLTGVTPLDDQVAPKFGREAVFAGVCNERRQNDTIKLSPQQLADDFLSKGYGTNYASSWFLARGSAKVRGSFNKQVGEVSVVEGMNMRSLRDTTGTLRRTTVNDGPHPDSIIPLMFDGQLAPGAARKLAEAVPNFLDEGAMLTEPYSRGPASISLRDTGGMRYWGTYRVTVHRQHPLPEIGVMVDEQPWKFVPDWDGKPQKLQYLQDWRAMGPVHAGDGAKSVNVLMADGSIRPFADANHDGFLNPGFAKLNPKLPWSEPRGEHDLDENRFRPADDTVELPAAQIFSGTFLHRYTIAE